MDLHTFGFEEIACFTHSRHGPVHCRVSFISGGRYPMGFVRLYKY